MDNIFKAHLRDEPAIAIDMGKEKSSLRVVQRLSGIHKKYLQWIVNRYIKLEFKLEDIPQLKEDLETFDKLKNKLPSDKKDINRYKSLNDFYDVLEQHKEEDTRSNKQKTKERRQELLKSGEAKVFYKDSEITVIIPETEEASCEFGKGTKWCTAARENNMFSRYHERGKMYIIQTSDKRKYQFHFETKQFMDERDLQVKLYKMIENYPSLIKAFGKKFGLDAIEESIVLKNNLEKYSSFWWLMNDAPYKKKTLNEKINKYIQYHDSLFVINEMNYLFRTYANIEEHKKQIEFLKQNDSSLKKLFNIKSLHDYESLEPMDKIKVKSTVFYIDNFLGSLFDSDSTLFQGFVTLERRIKSIEAEEYMEVNKDMFFKIRDFIKLSRRLDMIYANTYDTGVEYRNILDYIQLSSYKEISRYVGLLIELSDFFTTEKSVLEEKDKLINFYKNKEYNDSWLFYNVGGWQIADNNKIEFLDKIMWNVGYLQGNSYDDFYAMNKKYRLVNYEIDRP